MAVCIRLTRGGRKNRPFYRIGVFDERTRREGAALENLGHYNPIAEGKQVELNEERVKYWLGVGARPSPTVATFIKDAKIEYNPGAVRRSRNKKRAEGRKASKAKRKSS